MTEKELNQIQYLQKEINYLSEELEELRKRYVHTPEIRELNKVLYRKVLELRIQQNRLESFIANIGDSRVRMIFRLRHIKGMTWTEIGDEVGYTYEGARKLYKKELKKLTS